MTAHRFKMCQKCDSYEINKISPSFMSFCISVKYRNANSDDYDLLSAYCLVPHTVLRAHLNQLKWELAPFYRWKL